MKNYRQKGRKVERKKRKDDKCLERKINVLKAKKEKQ